MRLFVPTFLTLSFALLLCAGFSAPAFAKGGGDHAAEPGKSKVTVAGEAFYITMTPMVLPVMNEKGIREVVSMVVALEVKDSDNKDKVNDLVPRLNDAYMRALYGKLDSAVFRSGEFLDVNKLKTRLMAVTDNVVGKGKVDQVLIQGVNQRVF